MLYNKIDARSKMNEWGKNNIPFLFIADFELEKIVLMTDFDQQDDIRFEIRDFKSKKSHPRKNIPFPVLQVEAVDKFKYIKAFKHAIDNIDHGNSYLLNLTFASKIKCNLDLDEIYQLSEAKYKLRWKDEWVVFSPETFIRIKKNKIYSYPMKGTIDASEPNAIEKLLENEKELAEHFTIVDLIRNDIGKISNNVKVEAFRYFDKIRGNNRELYQTSSRIVGQLDDKWNETLGDILLELLPAGSISGAPKQKTLEIIKQAEHGPRGYYTGVFGYFNGEALDSGVMIRFIEIKDGEMYFRSGGGITSQSNAASEYKELIQKIYVPVN